MVLQKERKEFILSVKKIQHTKITKLITAVLITALFVTSTPELSVKKVLAAETAAWKVLGEKDLPVEELYGWYPDYDSTDQIMLGKKDGMLAFLDSSLNLVKKTKYDQIEDEGVIDDTDYNLLVSRKAGGGNEYAIIDKTGKTTVLGTYKKAEPLGLVGDPILSAEKMNGESGFLVDGKEIGFDKTFAEKPKGAVVCYNTASLGKSRYYVKQYFETKEVYDRVGEIYAGIDAEEIKEKQKEKKCEFVFYDETGNVVDIDLQIKEYEQAEKEKEEQKKKDVQIIAELRQTAASKLPIQKYIKDTWTAATGKYTVNDVTAYRFGQGYLAYVKADAEVLSEGSKYTNTHYFAGFFDREKKLETFGEVVAAKNEDYWDEGIYLTIRDSDKKIYFYGDDEYANTGHMVKYLYTDTDGIFAGNGEGELAAAYPHHVVLGGYGTTGFTYLAASPMNDFVKTTSMYTDLNGKNGLKAEYAIFSEAGGKREVVFYDSNWKKVIKRIDVSRLSGDITLCDGIVLGKTCAVLYKTRSGQYGLVGMDGNIVVDAEKEGYESGSVVSQLFEKTCVYFEKNNIRYYYYGGDFIPHTEEEYENWEDDGGAGGNEYGDITYDKDWIEDGSGNKVVREKVSDSAGNVLVSHKAAEDVYENERCENFIYIFKDCRSIVVVDRHWNGKRGEEQEEMPSAVPTSQPVDTAIPIDPGETRSPVAQPTSVPDIHPTQTPPAADDPMQTAPSAPGIQSTQTPSAPGIQSTQMPSAPGIQSTQTPSAPGNQSTQTPSAPNTHSTQVPQIVPSSGPAQTAPAQTAPPLIIEPEDEDEEEDKEEQFKKGDCFMSGNLGYQITKRKGKKGEVAVALVKSNKLKKIVVPKQVKKNGITFSVTSIGKNAFKGCKKVKTLQIKSLNIKSISKKALTGINKRVVIKVPRKKYWAYRIMLRKGGYYTIRR